MRCQTHPAVDSMARRVVLLHARHVCGLSSTAPHSTHQVWCPSDNLVQNTRLLPSHTTHLPGAQPAAPDAQHLDQERVTDDEDPGRDEDEGAQREDGFAGSHGSDKFCGLSFVVR